MKRNKVIVIGAGFAGLQFLQSIEKDRFDILLIDRLNHHQFQPLFYQVATSQLEPSSISFPLRHIFQDRKDIRIRMTSVRKILHEEHLIRTDIGDFPYDFLIIATGAQTNFYGNKEIATH
jgi:NADH dehydrogenase